MKQTFINFKCLLLVCLPFIINAQTSSYRQDSIRLVTSAYKTLHVESADNDFKKLNWQSIKVDTLPGEIITALKPFSEDVIEPILQIPVKDDTTKFILYTEQKGKKYYNWVFLGLNRDSAYYYSGKIETYTIKNQLINSWKIIRNRVTEGNGKSYKNFNTDSVPAVMITMTKTEDSSRLLAFSINQLLFNGRVKKDSPLSGALCFLNYNVLFLFPLFNGYESTRSEPLPVGITPGYNQSQTN